MKIFIKIITGYRQDEYITIPAREAHKAYYLFTHPNERGVFSNGEVLVGKDIRAIKPDYHATMGWNPTYRIESDDMNELISSGVYSKIEGALKAGKEVAEIGDVESLKLPLKQAYTKLISDPTKLEGTTSTKRTEELRTLKASKLAHITNNVQRT